MTTINSNPEIDAQSRKGRIFGIVYFAASISSIVVVARLYVRLVMLKVRGLDDWLIIVAQILAIGTAVTIGLEAHYGLGRHVWTVPKEDNMPYLKTFYSSILLYNLALAAVKSSILCQYRRIFITPRIQKLCFVGLIITQLWAFVQLFLNALTCLPVNFFWDPTVKGKCIPFLPLWYTYAAVNVLTDFGIFIIPLPALKSLQLPRRQKVILFLIFGLGFFTCTISLVRIHFLQIASKSVDPTWDNVDAATWSLLELCLAITAACLSTLRPLVIEFIPRLSNFSSRSRPDASVYIKQGTVQGRDEESGTTNGTAQYGPKNESTSSTEALNMDDVYQLQYLNQSGKKDQRHHETITSCVHSDQEEKSDGTTATDTTKSDNEIKMTTIIRQDFVYRK